MPAVKRQRELEEGDIDDADDAQLSPPLGDIDDADDADDAQGSASGAKAPAAEAPPPDADDADDADEARLAYSDEDDEGEGRRERPGRRSRRNHLRRQRDAEREQHVAFLAHEVATLQQQLAAQQRGQLSLAAGDIDAEMRRLQDHLAEIDAAFAKATQDGDGAAVAQARRLEREAQARLGALQVERRRLEQYAAATAQPRAPQPRAAAAPQQPDPAAVRHSERFMQRWSWFDPNDPGDEDSQIVKAVEDALANEGSNPATAAHWRELERRLRRRGLTPDGGDQMNDDPDDTAPPRRQALPPRARRGTGVHRGATFELTADMRDALDAEGLLDEKNLTKEQREYRKRLVSSWKSGIAALSQPNARR